MGNFRSGPPLLVKQLIKSLTGYIVGSSLIVLHLLGGYSKPILDTTTLSVGKITLSPQNPLTEPQISLQTPMVTLQQINWAFNGYEPGQCVWAVKEWRPDIPDWWGNADTWLINAQMMGWPTGPTPHLNAVGTVGDHVVLVVSLNPFMIKEMNYDLVPFHERTRLANPSDFYYIY